MEPTKYRSTRKMPAAIFASAVLSLGFLGLCTYAETYMPRTDHEYVHWIEIPQAVALTKKTGKPLLYDFSAEWCGPCQILAKKFFGNKNYAHYVNETYVPVRVIDRIQEENVNPIEVDALEKKYGVDGFPTLVIDHLNGSAPLTSVGYDGEDETYRFLQKSSIVMSDEYKYLRLNWRDLSEATKLSAQSKKPLLILFWDDQNQFSKHLYLADKDLVKMIDHDFISAEVSMPLDLKSIKSVECRKLLNKLAVKRAPAMVIVPADGSTPHFQLGSYRSEDNRDFLAKYLQLRKHEVPDRF